MRIFSLKLQAVGAAVAVALALGGCHKEEPVKPAAAPVAVKEPTSIDKARAEVAKMTPEQRHEVLSNPQWATQASVYQANLRKAVAGANLTDAEVIALSRELNESHMALMSAAKQDFAQVVLTLRADVLTSPTTRASMSKFYKRLRELRQKDPRTFTAGVHASSASAQAASAPTAASAQAAASAASVPVPVAQ